MLGGSNGATDAVVEGLTSYKKKTTPLSFVVPIQVSLDDSDQECTIVYNSIRGTGIQRAGGNNRPLVGSKTSILVKIEPLSLGASQSLTLWVDYIAPKDANAKHEHFVKKLNVYTPRTIGGPSRNAPGCSITEDIEDGAPQISVVRDSQMSSLLLRQKQHQATCGRSLSCNLVMLKALSRTFVLHGPPTPYHRLTQV